HARARQGRAGCGRDEPMSTRRLAVVVVTGFAVVLLLAGATSHPAGAQAPAAALTGRVTSAAEGPLAGVLVSARKSGSTVTVTVVRSEEHTSELQSRSDLVCRLLLEK